MSKLVHLGRSEEGAIALQGNQPVAVVEGEIIPLNTRESFQLAEYLIKGLIPATQVSEAVESALAIERASNHQLMAAMQDVVETAVSAMSQSHQFLLQQNQVLLDQNQSLTTALVESKPQSSAPQSQSVVIVERWGYSYDPMVYICMAFFATVACLTWMGVRANTQQSQPVPVYQSSAAGVTNV